MANLSKLPPDLIELIERHCKHQPMPPESPGPPANGSDASAAIHLGPCYGVLAALDGLAREMGLVQAVGEQSRLQRLALFLIYARLAHQGVFFRRRLPRQFRFQSLLPSSSTVLFRSDFLPFCFVPIWFGRAVSKTKIIHGEDGAFLNVNIARFESEVGSQPKLSFVRKLAALQQVMSRTNAPTHRRHRHSITRSSAGSAGSGLLEGKPDNLASQSPDEACTWRIRNWDSREATTGSLARQSKVAQAACLWEMRLF